MATQINTHLVDPGGESGSLPRTGPLAAELVARDYEGKSLVEFVLPDRFPGGPEVPFKASWWTVEPDEVTPEDVHDVQEVWFVGSGAGVMRLGERELDVRAGQAIHIEPQVPHQVRATGDEDLAVFSVWW
jgi:mannose-6-phosphate isomerase-like protein (cupin superfamily)